MTQCNLFLQVWIWHWNNPESSHCIIAADKNSSRFDKHCLWGRYVDKNWWCKGWQRDGKIHVSDIKVTLDIYTSSQCYGITTTKWHLRWFDRYLLFLVVCSIAERNTVDFINPLRNQIEWTHSQYCLGTAETQEMQKSQFRGSHLKWSLPSHCHLNALMQRGVSVKTIDISLNFYKGSCHKICHSKYCSELPGCRQMAILREK